MAQTGFTPIQIYSSSTAAAAPTAGNLANSTLGSELAINITDGKLFYKDNAGVVQVIGWKVVPATAGGTGQTSYAVGDILFANTTTSLAKLADVATGNALISGGVGVAPAYGKIGLTTHVSGTLPVANGGTGATSFSANQILYGAFSQSANLTYSGGNLNIATGEVVLDNAYGYKGKLVAGSAVSLILRNSSDQVAIDPDGYGTVIGFSGARLQVVGGNATLQNGNFVVGTSGKGIDFSATPGTGTSELFNDYEEGTWTPTDGSGAGLSLSASGAYTKIGRMVYWQAIVVYPVTANASSASIAGLPFALNLVSNVAGRSGSTITATDETTLVQSLQIETSNSVRFYKAGFVQNTNLELSGNQIYCAGFYST